MRGQNGISTGGLRDPVAQSIRNEQQHDARPSPDEIERRENRRRTMHAQYKATVALLDHFDARCTNEFVVGRLASMLGFDELARRSSQSHEHPDLNEDIRERKQDAFLVVQDEIERIERIDADRKILNPFGASKAWVLVVEDEDGRRVFTNDVFDRAMDRSARGWRHERFDDDEIDAYQAELERMLLDTMGVTDPERDLE